MKWNRTAISEWGCIVSGLIALATAIVWAFGIKPSPPSLSILFPAITVVAAIACATLFYLGKRLDHKTKLEEPPPADVFNDEENEEPNYQLLFLAESDARTKKQEECALVTLNHEQLKREFEQLKAEMLDTTVKDSEPKIDIQFVDDREHTVSTELYYGFDLINRSNQAEAKFACLDNFRIGGHQIKFQQFRLLLAPGTSYELYCGIDKPDGKHCELDIFDVFYEEYRALKNPQSMSTASRFTASSKMESAISSRSDAILFSTPATTSENYSAKPS